jgi:hypothetical protein
MPSSYTFCGTVAANFPESRDAHADIVGYVEPGAEREFDAPFGTTPPEDADERAWWFPAPTADWFPSDGELPKRLADPEPEEAADAGAGDEGGDGDQGAGGDGGEPEGHGEPPALPVTTPPGPLFTPNPAPHDA